MKEVSKRTEQTQKLVTAAILTALVIVLQLLGAFIKFGMFSISLVLIPIILGTVLCDEKIGAWLGFVFGATVLISGDAALFLGFSPIGTVITVLLKGILCGLLAGLAYRLFKKVNKYLAIVIAAIVSPIVNTGIFTLGCYVFFLKDIAAFGAELGYNNATECIFLFFIGGNFIFELIVNIILTPAIIRVLNWVKK